MTYEKYQISPPWSIKITNFRKIKMFFEHNTRCRTLHPLAMTRTRQKSIPFLSKIVRDWSICQSRTHMSAIWSGLNRNREIHAFFRKSRSMTCPPSLTRAHHTNIGKNQAQTCIAVAISRRSAELKPGNQRFYCSGRLKRPLTAWVLSTFRWGFCGSVP